MMQLECLNGYIEAMDEVMSPLARECAEREHEMTVMRWVVESLEEAMDNAEHHLPKSGYADFLARLRQITEEAQGNLKELASRYHDANDEYWAAHRIHIHTERRRDDV